MSRHLIENGLPWSWNEQRIQHCMRNRECVVLAARDRRRLVGLRDHGVLRRACAPEPARGAAGLPASRRRASAPRVARGVRAHGRHVQRASRAAREQRRRAPLLRAAGLSRGRPQSRVLRAAARTRCGCCTTLRSRRARARRRHDRERAARARAAPDRRSHRLRHSRRNHRQVGRAARVALARRGPRARREGDRS